MKQRLSLLLLLTTLMAVLLTGCAILDEAQAVVPTLLPTAQAIIQETANQTLPTPTAVVVDPAAAVEAPFVEAEDAAGQAQVVQPEPVDPTTAETIFIDLYQRVNPAVVSVNLQTGNGSGFVIDAEGYIVTNNHVVEAGGPIVIGFADGSQLDAEVIGTDALADIALLKVEAQPGQLTVLPLGDSDALQVGQHVVAIGSPFGLDNTMTTGIVSGLSRSLGSNNFTNGPTFQTPSIIQTDAAINPGNSGGPLINLDGEVVGINTAIESLSGSNSGVGFSVPSNVVKVVVSQLRATGEVRYPWMGISGGSLTSAMAERLGLPSTTRGVLVSDVTAGGPAEAAGLIGGDPETGLGGDVITAIDSQTVTEFDDLLGYIVQRATIGQTVTLTILRDGQPQTATVTLGERPAAVEEPQIEQLPGGQLP